MLIIRATTLKRT